MKTAQLHFLAIDIPVRVRPTMSEQNGKVSFKNIHEECGTPVKMPKFCPHCEREVGIHECVKGVEVSKGTIITVSDEEISSVAADRSPLIDLHKFVPLGDDFLNSQWIYSTHWLEPESTLPVYAENYAAFANALQGLDVAAVGTSALWGTERPTAITVEPGGALSMATLHTMPEYNDPPHLPTVGSPETISFLIDVIKKWIVPMEEKDLTVNPDLLLKELIGAKVAGNGFEPPVVEPMPAPTVDITEAIKKSMKVKAPKKKAA